MTDPPEEMFGKLMSVPDAAMGTYYELLLGEEPDPGAAAGGAEARRSRGASWSGFTATAAAAEAEAQFDRVHKEHRAPGGDRGGRRSRARTWRTAWSTCRPCWPTTSAPPAARPAGSWPRAGCGSTGSRSRRATSTSPVDRLAGAVLQVGRRKFRRIRGRVRSAPAAAHRYSPRAGVALDRRRKALQGLQKAENRCYTDSLP